MKSLGKVSRVALAVWVFVGCGEGGNPTRPPAWRVGDVASVVIGADEARPGHALHQVTGMARLSDGRIAIADRGRSELLIFDPQGDLIARLGGPGGGPDQLRYLDLLAKLAGDTLLLRVSDPAIAVVSPEGNVVRKEPYRYPGVAFACRSGGGCDSHFLQDGTQLVLANNGGTCEPFPVGTSRGNTLVGRYDWRVGTIDTVGTFPGPDWMGFTFGPEGTRLVGAVGRPYGIRVVSAVSSERIFVAETSADSIAVFTHAGQRVASMAVPFTPLPVSDRAKSVREPPAPGPGEVGPTEPYDYPDQYPSFARIVADAAGNLWVMKYPEFMEPVSADGLVCIAGQRVPDGGAEWLVLDNAGSVIAEVRTPERLFVVEIGRDYVLGVRRDSLDVQSVAVHDLRK